jgi:hypothetical protein
VAERRDLDADQTRRFENGRAVGDAYPFAVNR